MSKVPITQTAMLDALRSVADGNGSDEWLSEGLRMALLEFGSETPDNSSCASRFEIGSINNVRGLKLKNLDIMFSDLAYQLEDAPLPQAIKDDVPGITHKDWEAFMRFTVLLYKALEPD